MDDQDAAELVSTIDPTELGMGSGAGGEEPAGEPKGLVVDGVAALDTARKGSRAALVD